MNTRNQLVGLFTAALIVAGTGCKPNPPASESATLTPSPLASNTVLRVHWMGKHRLSVAAGAYTLMRIWNQPESAQLEGQSLERLALAILPPSTIQASGQQSEAVTLLQPLLNDALQSECFAEARRTANQGEEWMFAIRQDAADAKAWHHNLAGIVSLLRGAYPTVKAASWKLKDPHSGKIIELTQSGDWTVIGVAPAQNALLAETVARIEQNGSPYIPQSAENWVEATVNTAWAWPLIFPNEPAPTNLPQLSLTVSGDGAHVLTRGEMTFPAAPDLKLEPWQFPTGATHEPLVSFTAVRGIGPLLAASPIWRGMPAQMAPNEIFLWGLEGVPTQVLMAARTASAQDTMKTLTEVWPGAANPWLSRKDAGQFVQRPGGTGLMWEGLPLLTPFLQADGINWLMGGTVTNADTGTNANNIVYPRPVLAQMLADISSQTNLVYYDRELTGERIEACLYLAQVMRIGFHTAQLPPEAAGIRWLGGIRPRLANSTTTIEVPAPGKFVFTRQSTLGLTAAEIHLLVDWLESNRFPRGLRSLEAP
jgi:hypothetical protein